MQEQGRLALAHLDRYLELLRTPQAPDVQPPPAPPRPAGPDALWTGPRAAAALAWAPVVLLLPLALFEYPRSAPEHASALTACLMTTQILPLAIRSRWPLPVAAVIATALGAQMLLGHPVFNATLALPLALLTVAHRYSRRTSTAVAAVTVTALTASGLSLSAQYGVEYGIVLAIASAVAVYTGESWRLLAAQDAQWQHRLDRSAHDEQLRLRSAVGQERLRAAQDLHDSVGHVLSVVTLQAGAARMSVHTSPDRARAALDAIEDASLAALTELDRGIDVSGEDNGRVRTLADVRRLADTVRAAGVGVVLKIDDPGGGLPPLLETTAFRIVQEALTNAVKHAPGSTAVVTVVRNASRVELTVRNTAGRVPPVVDGVLRGRRGLHGMRERVALFGGELHAGPQPGGGFRVHATLPIVDLPTQRPAPAPEAPPVDESDRQLS